MFCSLGVLLLILLQLHFCVILPRLASYVHSISVLGFIKPTFLILRILVIIKMLMIIKFVLNVSFYGVIAISGPRTPYCRGFTITLRQTTIGKTFPDD